MPLRQVTLTAAVVAPLGKVTRSVDTSSLSNSLAAEPEGSVMVIVATGNGEVLAAVTIALTREPCPSTAVPLWVKSPRLSGKKRLPTSTVAMLGRMSWFVQAGAPTTVNLLPSAWTRGSAQFFTVLRFTGLRSAPVLRTVRRSFTLICTVPPVGS